MKIWLLISRMDVEIYDVYGGHVIAAETEEEARNIAPCATECIVGSCRNDVDEPHECFWQSSANASCECIGIAADGIAAGVLLSDFSAG